MQYVDYGKTGLKVSRFGMGCMRFPTIKNSEGKDVIDEEEAIKMVRYAVDNGVNYFDTAYTYPGSEVVLGKALKDGYREKVKIVSKLPVWRANTYEDYRKLLNEELKRLQVDYIDIYLLHNLTQPYWDSVKKLGGIKFMEEALEQGKIKHIGFSFHGSLDLFKEIIDSYDWEMCQIQLNILDENHQAGIEGLKYAASKGLPVVIMEPLRGGMLTQNIPDEVQKQWDKYPVKRSPAEWCFRWLYNMPEVTVVLSGVSSMQQLKDNIDIFNRSGINVMTDDEFKLIEKIKEIYNSKVKVGCTGCKYCMPCPQGVNIPEVFKLYNDIATLKHLGHSKIIYDTMLIEAGNGADQCVECGECETKCPQDIAIIEKLKEAHDSLKN